MISVIWLSVCDNAKQWNSGEIKVSIAEKKKKIIQNKTKIKEGIKEDLNNTKQPL